MTEVAILPPTVADRYFRPSSPCSRPRRQYRWLDRGDSCHTLLQSVVATVAAAVLPDGRDPVDILASQGRDVLRDTLTTSIRPLADRVVDARIEKRGNGREPDIGALRAVAKVIATMPASKSAPQATRLCEIFASRYDWSARPRSFPECSHTGSVRQITGRPAPLPQSLAPAHTADGIV